MSKVFRGSPYFAVKYGGLLFIRKLVPGGTNYGGFIVPLRRDWGYRGGEINGFQIEVHAEVKRPKIFNIYMQKQTSHAT